MIFMVFNCLKTNAIFFVLSLGARLEEVYKTYFGFSVLCSVSRTSCIQQRRLGSPLLLPEVTMLCILTKQCDKCLCLELRGIYVEAM